MTVGPLNGEAFGDGRWELDDVRAGIVGGEWFSDWVTGGLGVLANDRVTTGPATPSNLVSSLAGVFAAMAGIELTSVVDGEGLSNAVVGESAIRSIRLHTPTASRPDNTM